MANQKDISVGSTDFVVRIGGKDVPVKIMEKKRKQSGRGFEFRVRRVGPDGKVFGRSLVRGSGALRKPGDPVKGFGGKAPKKARAPRRAPKRPKTKPNRPTPPPSTSPLSSPGSSSLPSLRGRGRTSSSSSKRSAPARGTRVKEDGYKFKPKNELVKQTMRALERLPETADTYMVRNTVAQVLADHERAKYFRPFQAAGR